jgi:hypothetical protein
MALHGTIKEKTKLNIHVSEYACSTQSQKSGNELRFREHISPDERGGPIKTVACRHCLV